tara:strand:+ start:1454 stop:1630 length:177 start_codon:yes stop_codon:yes gene_type:complete
VVSSYLTFSPLPDFWRLFSVALSVNSRFPGVTWRSCLWSPDFPLQVAATALLTPDLII